MLANSTLSWLEAPRSLIYHDILPHLPSWRLLLMLIPLFFQLLLLHPPQTETTRFLRKALLPLGLYFSYQVTQYDFVPRDAFRPYNFIKNLAFLIGVSKTLVCGSVVRSNISLNIQSGIRIRQRSLLLDWLRQRSTRNGQRGEAACFEFGNELGSRPVRCDSASQVRPDLRPPCMAKLACSHRGQGWSWGIKRDLIPPPHSAQDFVRDALKRVLRSHILLVAVMSTIQYSQNHDQSDFLAGLGIPSFPYSSILSDLSMAVTFGTAVWNFLECGFSVTSLGAYMITKVGRALPIPEAIKPDAFDVRAWAPLLRNPLRSTSLADWWTYRWHRYASFLRTFEHI